MDRGFAIWKVANEKEEFYKHSHNCCCEDGFIFHPFDSQQNNSLFFEKGKIDINSIDFKLQESQSFHQETKEEYIEKVKNAMTLLDSGAFNKIAVSSVFDIKTRRINPIEIYRIYVSYFKTAYKHLVYIPNSLCSIGASPEILLQKKGNKVKTMALAATKSATDKTDWNEKEQKEQSIISDYIQQQLQGFAEPLKAEETKELIAGNIKHLCTCFRAESNNNWDILAQQLHPTPAVGTMPKQNGMSTISAIEQYDRNYYCGYIGTYGQNTNLAVNIRCMELFDNKIRFYIGAGITKDSVPEEEWNEFLRKFENLKNPLKAYII